MNDLIKYLKQNEFSVTEDSIGKLFLKYEYPHILSDFYIDNPGFFDKVKQLLIQVYPKIKAIVFVHDLGFNPDIHLLILYYFEEIYLELLPEEIILEVTKFFDDSEELYHIKESSLNLNKILTSDQNLKYLINSKVPELKIYRTQGLNYARLYEQILSVYSDLIRVLNESTPIDQNIFNLYSSEIRKAARMAGLSSKIIRAMEGLWW